MSKKQRKDLRLLLDVPEHDVLFGFESYASTLASAILGTEAHFTIGIFGGWGHGKTTLLKNLKTHLQTGGQDEVVTVLFDAWRYQKEEYMLLPLLDVICYNLKQMKGGWQETLGKNLKRIASAFAESTTIGFHGTKFDLKKAKEELQRDDDTLHSNYYGWLEELQAALDTIRGDSHPKRRIVVLIDDLDRCMPHKIVDVLESIKLMLDVSGFVFVLALDPDIIKRAVETYYGEEGYSSGSDYLKKLVQVEFHIPPLRPQDVKEYVQRLQKGLPQTELAISEALAQAMPVVAEDNLREVKRFTNQVLLSTAITENLGLKVPVASHIALMAMKARWPQFVKLLSQDLGLLSRIRSYLQAKADGLDIALDKEAEEARAMLDELPELQSFLQSPFCSELLSIKDSELNKILFYSAITETAKSGGLEHALIAIVANLLDTLSPREKRVIILRYGLEDGRARTIEEVSKEFMLPPDRIKRIEDVALRKLRHPSRSRKLEDIPNLYQDIGTL